MSPCRLVTVISIDAYTNTTLGYVCNLRPSVFVLIFFLPCEVELFDRGSNPPQMAR